MPDTSPATGDTPTEFEAHQAALLAVLAEREQLLAQMYGGAIRALASGHPDSLPQSAHSLRELLEKLPEYFDVPKEKSGPSLTEASKTLRADVQRAKTNSACWSDGAGWDGEMDGALKRLLKRLDMFIAYLDASKPPRRGQAKQFFRTVDVGPYPIPTAIEDLRLEEWERYRRYFLGIAHHTKVDTAEQFRATLWRFEEFLLNQLVPRTYDDRAIIAKIVTEVEDRDE